jgi:nitroimidazol reductase NimA-like FMN-containing flavoprotein (pyridoxamine 5'-phosphate oxidase superfamily)
MTQDRSTSTATARNAMTPDERDAFLAPPRLTRLTTLRSDGWPHITPAWYLWRDGAFYHSIGAGRVHLRNLAANPKVTECVDIDERLGGALSGRAAAVVCFGLAEILEDHEENVRWNERILSHYLQPDDARRYLEMSVAEIPRGRRVVRVVPQRWMTWDYTKASAE